MQDLSQRRRGSPSREDLMAYRELTMIDVREVLRRWQAGQSGRQIARETGFDRKTVRRYVEAANACELARDRALTEGEVHEVGQRVQARPLVVPSEPWEALVPHRDRIADWLGGSRPLRLRKVHVLLERDGVSITYPTLRRFAMRELEWGKPTATVLLSDPPAGQEAQVDFAQMGIVFDPETSKRRTLWVLIVTLSFSRHMFVWPTFFQTTEAVCEGLDAAWTLFGGMPHTLIPDNTKAMILEPDALGARMTEAFADYMQARGMFCDPARVRRPKDKPRVERQVQYVRDNWFAGESFTTLEDARTQARDWCLHVAGTRVHGTTREVPLARYEQQEKHAMLPPPRERFDVPLWTTAKVHPDHHIQVARSLYSVPTQHLHKTARVRADRTSVRIYVGTELVKVHPRKRPGERSTDANDYPVGKAAYALRSIDGLLDRARLKGLHVGRYAERLLAGPLPWTRMRQAYALLALCDKYGEGRTEAVCQTALAFDVVDVPRIGRMLKAADAPRISPAADGKVVQLQLAPRFARALEHFITRSGSKEEA
jgi:transposase